MDAEREGETVSEPATAAGRALLERRSAFNGGKHASVTLPSEQWNEAILAIEAEARAAEREYQRTVRKDWGTLPHGEFHEKYGRLDRDLYLLPANCGCRECQMWSS